MLVGIDVGTSLVKATAFDESGRVTATRSVPARLDIRDQHVEQDADKIFEAAAEALGSVAVTPRLVGVTGQGDGVWLLDGTGKPVRPAISWMDGRASALVAEWEAAGIAAEVFRRTGNTIFPGCPAPLLAWLDRHEPASLDAATTAGYCKDMLFQRLTGIRATDPSDASVPFLNPHTRDYDRKAITAVGLSHRADLLAPISDPVPAGEAAGGLLAAGTPVSCGPFDVPAAALGAGVTEPGDGLLIIGTTLACLAMTDTVTLDGERAGFHFATGRRGRWLRGMPAMVGTAALDWVLSTLGTDHQALAALLDASPPGSGGVKVLPYFAPSGERAPFVEPAARAEFTGVSLHTGRADLIRATCEGIAYAARHCLEAAGLSGNLAVAGGGARSDGWLQLFADVLGRPLRIAPGEAGARGAVLAAAQRLGTGLDPEEWTRAVGVRDPDPARAAYYQDGYADYLDRVVAARQRWSTS
jgi:xylulokinase